MRTIDLRNSAHLGDNLILLNYLNRAVRWEPGLHFRLFCQPEYHQALQPLAEAPVSFHPVEEAPGSAPEMWIGGDLFPGFYQRHPHRHNYARFHWEWLRKVSDRIGILHPMIHPDDLLFYHPKFDPFSGLSGPPQPGIDVLVLDCEPKSGQLAFHPARWREAAARWRSQGLEVRTVADQFLTLGQIGRLAATARHVVGVGTGPLHVAMNHRSQRHVESWHLFDCYHEYGGVAEEGMKPLLNGVTTYREGHDQAIETLALT